MRSSLTDQDKWKLIRAAELYERQWVFIQMLEFPDRSKAALHQYYARLTTIKWVPQKGVKRLDLVIETDPEKVFCVIRDRINAHASRSFMPDCLAKYNELEEDSPQLAESEDAKPRRKEIVALERKVLSLADKLREAKRKLTDTNRDENTYQRLAKILRAEVAPLDTKATSMPKKSKSQTVVHGVAQMSDEHADLVVEPAATWGLEHYDFDIFRCRLERWAKVLSEYVTVHLPCHHFEHLWILKLGDAVQGDIHDNKHRNHFRNSMVASIAIGDAEAQAFDWVQRMTGTNITVICVPGNHGRTTPKIDATDPHDNYDYLVATQIATRLSSNERIQVYCPRAWTAFAEMLGWIFSINHGHGVRGFAGFPWYGFDRKAQRVQSMVAKKGFRVDFFGFGHFHTDTRSSSAGAKLLHNGAWYMTDPHALEQLGVGNTPQQNFYVIDRKYGLIGDLPIYVTDKKSEDLMIAGKHNPAIGRDIVIDTMTPLTQDFTLIKP